MPAKQIPVYIVTGQLDSGKTTFVKDTLMQQDWLEDGRTLLLLCEEGEFELSDEYCRIRKIDRLSVEAPDVFTKEFCEELVRKYAPAQIIRNSSRRIFRRPGGSPESTRRSTVRVWNSL